MESIIPTAKNNIYDIMLNDHAAKIRILEDQIEA
jgi:hypothetical protein